MQTRPSEREGSLLLRQEFDRAGLAIQENCPVEIDGVPVELDGFDPARRIGFEFITTEAGDRKTITPELTTKLEQQMSSGSMHVLLIDEWDVETADDLVMGARRFLDELRKRGLLA
jgi:nucleotide-binding universal stress UspA family protein